MEMKIETLPSYTIAYIRHTGPYGVSNAQTMGALKNWAKSNHLFDDDAIILGIARDDPAFTQPESCRYDACMVITGDVPIYDETVQPGSIAGGKYSVFTIPHTPEAMQKAWTDIFPELHRLGYHLDNTRSIIERYATRLVNAHLCEICAPVI
jgi:DNA gyrase inhibitor GyrI